MVSYKTNISSYVWFNTLSFKKRSKLSVWKWKEMRKRKFGLPVTNRAPIGRGQLVSPLYNVLSPSYLNYGRFLNPQIGGGSLFAHNSLSYSSSRFNSRLFFKKPTLKPRNGNLHLFNPLKSPWDKFWWNSRWGFFRGIFSPFQHKLNLLVINSDNLISPSPLKKKKKNL